MWVRFGLYYSHLLFVSSQSLFFFPIVHVFHTSTPYFFFCHFRQTLSVRTFPRKLSIRNFSLIIFDRFFMGNFRRTLSVGNFPCKLSVRNFPRIIFDGLQKIRQLKFPMTFFSMDFCPLEIDSQRRIFNVFDGFWLSEKCIFFVVRALNWFSGLNQLIVALLDYLPRWRSITSFTEVRLLL